MRYSVGRSYIPKPPGLKEYSKGRLFTGTTQCQIANIDKGVKQTPGLAKERAPAGVPATPEGNIGKLVDRGPLE